MIDVKRVIYFIPVTFGTPSFREPSWLYFSLTASMPCDASSTFALAEFTVDSDFASPVGLSRALTSRWDRRQTT